MTENELPDGVIQDKNGDFWDTVRDVRVCKNCKQEKILSHNKAGLCAKRKECRARRIRERRDQIPQGSCSTCGNPAVDNRTHCQKCLDYTKTLYHGKVSRGLCTKCGKPAIASRTLCQEHQDSARKRNRSRYNTRVSQGLCTRCGKPATKGRMRCGKCIQNDKTISEGPGNQVQCLACSKPTVQNQVLCQEHFEYVQELYNSRVSQGLCFACAQPAVEGKDLCQQHLNDEGNIVAMVKDAIAHF